MYLVADIQHLGERPVLTADEQWSRHSHHSTEDDIGGEFPFGLPIEVLTYVVKLVLKDEFYLFWGSPPISRCVRAS